MIRAVFLDIDNTILSFTEYVKDAMEFGFREFGLGEYSEETFLTFEEINSGLWHRLEKGELTLEGLKKIRWNMVFEKLGIKYDGEEFERWFRKYLFTSAIPEPNAFEVVSYLSSKYCVCAASNGPFEQQENRLRVAGMLEFFDFLFVSSDIGFQKPSKEFFIESFQRLEKCGISISPSEAIIIGDSVSSDMAGGKGFGMKTCFYTRGGEGKCERSDVDYVIDDLKELLNIL